MLPRLLTCLTTLLATSAVASGVAVPPAQDFPPVVYLAVGDSVAAGVGAVHRPRVASWPALSAPCRRAGSG